MSENNDVHSISVFNDKKFIFKHCTTQLHSLLLAYLTKNILLDDITILVVRKKQK